VSLTLLVQRFTNLDLKSALEISGLGVAEASFLDGGSELYFFVAFGRKTKGS